MSEQLALTPEQQLRLDVFRIAATSACNGYDVPGLIDATLAISEAIMSGAHPAAAAA